MASLVTILPSATATAGLVAALLFLKFWRRTMDSFFLLFAAAFAIDAIGRFALAIGEQPEIAGAIYFLPRLVMFSLIVIAIIRNNAPPV